MPPRSASRWRRDRRESTTRHASTSGGEGGRPHPHAGGADGLLRPSAVEHARRRPALSDHGAAPDRRHGDGNRGAWPSSAARSSSACPTPGPGPTRARRCRPGGQPEQEAAGLVAERGLDLALLIRLRRKGRQHRRPPPRSPPGGPPETGSVGPVRDAARPRWAPMAWSSRPRTSHSSHGHASPSLASSTSASSGRKASTARLYWVIWSTRAPSSGDAVLTRRAFRVTHDGQRSGYARAHPADTAGWGMFGGRTYVSFSATSRRRDRRYVRPGHRPRSRVPGRRRRCAPSARGHRARESRRASEGRHDSKAISRVRGATSGSGASSARSRRSPAPRTSGSRTVPTSWTRAHPRSRRRCASGWPVVRRGQPLRGRTRGSPKWALPRASPSTSPGPCR